VNEDPPVYALFAVTVAVFLTVTAWLLTLARTLELTTMRPRDAVSCLT
jgi:hypothetical protein